MYTKDKAPAAKTEPAHHPQTMLTVQMEDETERFGFVYSCAFEDNSSDTEGMPELVDDSGSDTDNSMPEMRDSSDSDEDGEVSDAYPDVYVTTTEEEGEDTDEFPPAANIPLEECRQWYAGHAAPNNECT